MLKMPNRKFQIHIKKIQIHNEKLQLSNKNLQTQDKKSSISYYGELSCFKGIFSSIVTFCNISSLD